MPVSADDKKTSTELRVRLQVFIVGTVVSIFLLMFVGYGAKKLRLLRAEDADLFGAAVLYITLPAYVFDAIYSFHRKLPPDMVKVPLVGFAGIMLTLGLAYLLGRLLKLERSSLGGFIIASGFGNTGFLGYPVVQAALGKGEALVTAALYDEVAMAMPLYTLGAVIAAYFAGSSVDKDQLRKVFTIPSLWAIPTALLLRSVRLPTPLVEAIQYLALGTIPMAMITLGLSISARSLKGIMTPVLVASVLKLAILPLITYFLITPAGVSGVIRKATVLEAGMPTAVMCGVVATKFGRCGGFVAGIIFVSTLLSIATIPTILLLMP